MRGRFSVEQQIRRTSAESLTVSQWKATIEHQADSHSIDVDDIAVIRTPCTIVRCTGYYYPASRLTFILDS